VWASNQEFRVELRDPANNVLTVLRRTQSGEPLLSDWTNRVFNLWAYRGQTIRVAFIEEDSLGSLNIGLDNISVLAVPPAPTIFDVYFGTAAIPGPAQFLGSTANNFWSLPSLLTNTTYHWQVKSRRGGQTNAGPVWQFTTTPSTNHPPSLALGSPGHFAVFPSPTNVWIDLSLLQDDGTITKVEFYADNLKMGESLIAPQSYNWVNPLVGEHSLYAVAIDSGGLRGTSAVQRITVLPPPGTMLTTLVPFNANWRYLDTGTNLGTQWRSTSFTGDRYWPSGPARFGFGKGDEATRIDFGDDPGAKHITTYFRTSFTTPVNSVQTLILRALRDDGVAVYLNNNEILRDNLTAGAGYSTPALSEITGVFETLPITRGVALSNLVGRSRSNSLAAEVHLSSTKSVDMIFNFELTAVVGLRPTVTLSSPLAESVFLTPADLVLAASASEAYGAISNLEFFADNQSLGLLTHAPYTLIWSNAPPGDHLLWAIATDQQGASASSVATFVRIFTPTPTLTVAPGSSSLDLTWPLTAANYHLESTTNLNWPAVWTPVTNAPVITNGQVLFSLPATGEPQRYFRLAAP
jgi:hypothetical protein